MAQPQGTVSVTKWPGKSLRPGVLLILPLTWGWWAGPGPASLTMRQAVHLASAVSGGGVLGSPLQWPGHPCGIVVPGAGDARALGEHQLMVDGDIGLPGS